MSDRRYARSGRGLEFERLSFFTDAVFAIAMTLLVVALAVPAVRDTLSARDLLDALGNQASHSVAFFIGFAILGFYWNANHRFYGQLESITGGYIGVNLLYLAFVAWLPFPTALLGEYVRNPVAVTTFALSAGFVSGCEVLLMRQANADCLLRVTLPVPVHRHAIRASLLPVAFFALSIPIAFVSTYVAIASWALAIPGEIALDRGKPTGFDAYFD